MVHVTANLVLRLSGLHVTYHRRGLDDVAVLSVRRHESYDRLSCLPFERMVFIVMSRFTSLDTDDRTST